MFQLVGRRAKALIAAAAIAALAAPSSAFLFWSQPKLSGEKVRGDEPGIAVPMPGATPKEVSANLLWAMRAGLNVAALQCQFAPALMTVDNYNKLLKIHSKEFGAAIVTLNGYFKRTQPKGWQVAFERYSTQTWNGFSTIQAQLEFCEAAAAIGRAAQGTPDGKLVELAQARMRDFRNSLAPTGDAALVYRAPTTALLDTAPDIGCFSKKGKPEPCRN